LQLVLIFETINSNIIKKKMVQELQVTPEIAANEILLKNTQGSN
jgi:hypothetical protein